MFDEATLLKRYDLVGGPEELRSLLKGVAKAISADSELAALGAKWHRALYVDTPGADLKTLRTWVAPEAKLGELTGAFNMALALSAVPLVEATHRRMGLPPERLAETFSWYRAIITAYARRHNGVPGIDHTRLFWFRNHIDGTLFRLGEMEFLRGPVPEYVPADFKATLAPDDEVPSFHYPGGPSGLDPAAFKAAYGLAMEFWKEHFGHYPRAWASESWLFNPVWKELLPNSRIAHSTDIYEYLGELPYNPEETPGIYYVYADDKVDPRDYPMTTSLERAFAKIFERGDKLIEGACWVRCEGAKVLFNDERK